MRQIPSHGLVQTSIESGGGLPAKLAPDAGGVDGITGVVAGAVGGVGNQRLITRQVCGVWIVGAGVECIEDGANGTGDVDITLFIVAADVVGTARSGAGKHLPKGSGVVVYIKPVADLLAVAVKGQRFAV